MKNYDAIVVGAGMAGQTAAAFLAREGKQVLLLEQNHHTGGNMSGFSRQGFSFDGGDQSFESLGLVFPILKSLAGYTRQDFIKARYRMVSGDFDFTINSPSQVARELQKAFPKEPGIEPLFAEIQQVQDFLKQNYHPWDFPLLNRPSLRSAAKILPWLPKLKKWSTFRYREKALRQIQHPGLRSWLTHVGYYRMPFLFFAGFWHLWSEDYWYPKGGMQSVHDRLAAAFQDSGGHLRLNTMVQSIDTDPKGRRVRGVTTTKGEVFRADKVIHAGDYKKMITQLLPQKAFPAKLRNRLTGAKLTEALVSVYLGLDMNPGDLGKILGHAQHPFFFPNYDVIFPDGGSPPDVHRQMWLALNHFGEESPSAPAGKTTLTLQTFTSMDWQNLWQNGAAGTPRTAEYKALKEKVGQEMVNLAENMIPGLSSRIEYMDVGTPLSLHRFTRNTDGSSGGWCYDDQISPVWRLPTLNRMKTPVKGLTAAGHYALWPGGVISAALSGRMAANMVQDRFPLAKLS